MNNLKFKKYEEIRQSGLTNMFDVKSVVRLSEGVLTSNDCLDIMKHYGRYKEVSSAIKRMCSE